MARKKSASRKKAPPTKAAQSEELLKGAARMGLAAHRSAQLTRLTENIERTQQRAAELAQQLQTLVEAPIAEVLPLSELEPAPGRTRRNKRAETGFKPAPKIKLPPNIRSKKLLDHEFEKRGIRRIDLEQAAHAYDEGRQVDAYTALASAVVDYLNAGKPKQITKRWEVLPDIRWDLRQHAGRLLHNHGWVGVTQADSQGEADEQALELTMEARGRLLRALCAGDTTSD